MGFEFLEVCRLAERDDIVQALRTALVDRFEPFCSGLFVAVVFKVWCQPRFDVDAVDPNHDLAVVVMAATLIFSTGSYSSREIYGDIANCGTLDDQGYAQLIGQLTFEMPHPFLKRSQFGLLFLAPLSTLHEESVAAINSE